MQKSDLAQKEHYNNLGLGIRFGGWKGDDMLDFRVQSQQDRGSEFSLITNKE